MILDPEYGQSVALQHSKFWGDIYLNEMRMDIENNDPARVADFAVKKFDEHIEKFLSDQEEEARVEAEIEAVKNS